MCNDRFLPLHRQFLLIPNRISKCTDLRANCSIPAWNHFCWDLISTLISTSWFYLFSFSIAISTSNALGSGSSGSAECIFVCLNITNPLYINYLREVVPPPSQDTVGVCNQIILLIHHCITSRLVTLLKVIDAPLQDWYFLSVSLINFSFQVFLNVY